MPNLVALIDSNFTNMLAYYRMFSCDETWAGHIEIQPRDVHAISLSSFEALLTHIRDHLLRGKRGFLIGMHGHADSLPYPVIEGTGVSPDVQFMNLLQRAAAGGADAKAEMLTWTDSKNRKIFPSGTRADKLIQLVSQIRMNRIDHLEIRGCNIGAGGALKAFHECLNSRHTVAPTVTFVSGITGTAGIRTISQTGLKSQIDQLPAPKRTFSRTDCLLPASTQAGSDESALGLQINEVSLKPHRFSIGIRALNQDAVQGWSKVFFENSYYFVTGRTTAGGGFRRGGNLPMIGMWTSQGKQPFLFPGDGFDYLNTLAVENSL